MRDNIGGTWDLFRYPGIRSDSDMYTLGFSFKPWTDPKAIASGGAILEYLQEAITEHNLDSKVQLKSRLVKAHWDSNTHVWTLEVDVAGTMRQMTCDHIYLGA